MGTTIGSTSHSDVQLTAADEAALVCGETQGLIFQAQLITPPLEAVLMHGNGDGLDLSGVDFTAVDFRSCSLKGADFSRCNLTSARFVKADLSGAKLIGAILSGADLSGARLSGATFDGANLSNAKLSEVNPTGVDFGGVDLTTTTFDPNPVFSTDPNHLTKFVGSRVRLATLGKNWSYLALTGATIVGLEKSTDLSGLQARYAVLAGIDLSGYQLAGACLNNANLSGATLSGATLSDAKFQSATLLAARLVGTNLTHADLSGAQLGGQPGSLAANLSYAFMWGAILDKANLYGVDFSYATIVGASFQNTTSMEQTSFTNAYVENVDLSGSAPYLRGANLVGACLINC